MHHHNAHTIETIIDLGDRTAPVTARVNRRARRLIVRVDSVQGRVHVTAPSMRALPEALEFAKTRTEWIRAQLDDGAHAKPFRHGSTFPFRGEELTILNEGAPRAGVRLQERTLMVGGRCEHVNRRVVDWLKQEARSSLTARVDFYAGELCKRRGPITIRDTRWGSCGPDGALSFSWRLVLAPSWVHDYVAAHECAHLVHLNHSPAFWRLLKALNVDAPGARAWFAAHGLSLYSWGVEPNPGN